MPTRKEKPTIELFMFSLHQEFPEGVAHDTFLERKVSTHDAIDTAGQAQQIHKVVDQELAKKAATGNPDWWVYAKWVTNHTKAVTGMPVRGELDPMTQALSRVEEFGGIIYDPTSDKVFKVNEAGLELFLELQAASRDAKKAQDVKSANHSQQDVDEFLAFLRGAGMWVH